MALNIHLLPKGINIEHQPGTTLLESAVSAGISLRHSCEAGTCKVCQGKLVNGSVKLKNNIGEFETITPNNPKAATLLSCLAIPITDCTLEIKNVLAKAELPLFTAACQIKEAKPLNHDVTLYVLRLPAGKKIHYHAGQYLELLLNEGTENERCFPFSIANAQNKERTLELHIRDVPGNDALDTLKDTLNVGDMVKARLPKGECTLAHLFDDNKLTEQQAPLIFLAGSTGFSPVKAMIEDCLIKGITRPIYLYWGGRTLDDIYLHELAAGWDRQNDNFTYVPVISEPERMATWQGRTGFVHKALMDDFSPLGDSLMIIAGGSPGMVHAAYDDFIAAGLKKDQLHSDVFAYAPK